MCVCAIYTSLHLTFCIIHLYIQYQHLTEHAVQCICNLHRSAFFLFLSVFIFLTVSHCDWLSLSLLVLIVMYWNVYCPHFRGNSNFQLDCLFIFILYSFHSSSLLSFCKWKICNPFPLYCTLHFLFPTSYLVFSIRVCLSLFPTFALLLFMEKFIAMQCQCNATQSSKREKKTKGRKLCIAIRVPFLFIATHISLTYSLLLCFTSFLTTLVFHTFYFAFLYNTCTTCLSFSRLKAYTV